MSDLRNLPLSVIVPYLPLYISSSPWYFEFSPGCIFSLSRHWGKCYIEEAGIQKDPQTKWLLTQKLKSMWEKRIHLGVFCYFFKPSLRGLLNLNIYTTQTWKFQAYKNNIRILPERFSYADCVFLDGSLLLLPHPLQGAQKGFVLTWMNWTGRVVASKMN